MSKSGACILLRVWGVISREPTVNRKEDQLRCVTGPSSRVVVALSKTAMESIGLADELDMGKKKEGPKIMPGFMNGG